MDMSAKRLGDDNDIVIIEDDKDPSVPMTNWNEILSSKETKKRFKKLYEGAMVKSIIGQISDFNDSNDFSNQPTLRTEGLNNAKKNVKNNNGQRKSKRNAKLSLKSTSSSSSSLPSIPHDTISSSSISSVHVSSADHTKENHLFRRQLSDNGSNNKCCFCNEEINDLPLKDHIALCLKSNFQHKTKGRYLFYFKKRSNIIKFFMFYFYFFI